MKVRNTDGDHSNEATPGKTRMVVRKAKKGPGKKALSSNIKDADAVAAYMKKLKHPLKAEMEVVRNIIKNSSNEIKERIKWKAPSYYYKDQDMVTFNGWAEKQVHLVFHHPEVIRIKSFILDGDYDTRRMVYFNNMREVRDKKGELEKVMQELLRKIDKGSKSK
jgi:uncharacterized protein YdeI (YjbR/CyaY-like superfamily)